MPNPHNHGHHHHDISGKNIGLTIILNLFITLAQLIGGVISGSMVLLTDALHNFSDVIPASPDLSCKSTLTRNLECNLQL